MHKKRIAALTLAAIIFNFSSNTVGVLAHEVEQIKPKQGISSKKDVQSNQAKVSKFDLLNNKNLEKYNKVFKLDKSKIIAITTMVVIIQHQSYIKLLIIILALIGKQEDTIEKTLKMK